MTFIDYITIFDNYYLSIASTLIYSYQLNSSNFIFTYLFLSYLNISFIISFNYYFSYYFRFYYIKNFILFNNIILLTIVIYEN